MEKKNIIAFINTKGGVGKTKISTQVATVALAKAEIEFSLIEMDNNNCTPAALQKSVLLAEKFKTLDLKASEQELERMFVELSIDSGKHYIIDVGGGDDTKNFIKMIKSEGLDKNTLFIVPYTADFEALQNLHDTLALIQDQDYFVVLNNVALDSRDHMIFADGEKDLKLENMKKKIGEERFFIVPNTPFFSLSVAQHKMTAWDIAQVALKFTREQILEKHKDNGLEESLEAYRRWKISNDVVQYFEQHEVTRLIEAIQKTM